METKDLEIHVIAIDSKGMIQYSLRHKPTDTVVSKRIHCLDTRAKNKLYEQLESMIDG